MSAKLAVPRRTGPPAGGVEYARECIGRLARILVHSGHSPQTLWRELRNLCNTLKEPAQRFDPRDRAYFADIPHALAHWHSDPQYLDSRGAPVPLPLRGRGPSLCAFDRSGVAGRGSGGGGADSGARAGH